MKLQLHMKGQNVTQSKASISETTFILQGAAGSAACSSDGAEGHGGLSLIINNVQRPETLVTVF